MIVSMVVACWLTVGFGSETNVPPATATARRPLRCVYFTPADCEPHPGRAERLYRVMTCVQNFYRREMERNGMGPLTFALEEEAPGRLKLYEVRGTGRQLEYGRRSAGRIHHEVAAALRAHGLDAGRERIVVFQRGGLVWKDGQSREISPYVGSWTPICGICMVYDDPLIDARLLRSRAPGGSYCGSACSVGKFNSHYIGGIAHELGHALTLPHDGETPEERRTRGRSLMGGGNHTFGCELRQEGLGTFLTATDALRLSAVSTINGGEPVARKNDVTLEFSPLQLEGGRLQVKGRVTTARPIRGLLVYVDPDVPATDYDAQTWIVKPAADGTFDTVLKGIPEVASGIRVWVVRDCDSVLLYRTRLKNKGQ